jgi:hypothetical protein
MLMDIRIVWALHKLFNFFIFNNILLLCYVNMKARVTLMVFKSVQFVVKNYSESLNVVACKPVAK